MLKLRDSVATGGGLTEELGSFFNNSSIEQVDIGDLIIVGDKVYRDIGVVGGGDLHWYHKGAIKTLNCTTGTGVDGKYRIEIGQGEEHNEMLSITYATFSDDRLECELTNSSALPVGSYVTICLDSIETYVQVAIHGGIISQRLTEAVGHNDQGALARVKENIRITKYSSLFHGVEPTINFTGGVSMSVTGGIAVQLNRQSFPPLNMATDGAILVGVENDTNTLGNLSDIGNLNIVRQLSDGTAINTNDIVFFDFIGLVNDKHETCKLCVIAPTIKMTSEPDAKLMAEGFHFSKVPIKLRTTAFDICRFALKWNGTSFVNLWNTASYEWKTQWITPVKSQNYPSYYPNNWDQTFTINAPAGATHVQLVFRDFNMENNYDTLKVQTLGGSTAQTLTNILPNYYVTNTITGAGVKLVAHTDGSVGRKGFYTEELRYRILVVGYSTKFIDFR